MEGPERKKVPHMTASWWVGWFLGKNEHFKEIYISV